MLCGSLEAGSGPRGRVRRFRSRCAACLPPPLEFRSAARPARLRQTACAASLYKCFPRTRMCAEKPECMGIDALRAIPVAGLRRSAPEGGRSPRMLRTRPPLGFPPSRRKSPARSQPTAPPVAAADPCPAAEGAGHPAPRRRDPDGPRGTLPARLRAARSSALATAPVPPPPPAVLPPHRENAVAPDGPSCAPAGTGGFLPSPTHPETIPQTPPADSLRPETAGPDPDRTPPAAAVLRRVHAGNPDGAPSGPFTLARLQGTRGAGVPRRPRSRSARPPRNMVLGVRGPRRIRPAGRPPGRRRLGEPVRMVPRNQSRELVTALGGRSRKAPDGRGPHRRLPPVGLCSRRAVAVVRACIRSRPALPARRGVECHVESAPNSRAFS